MEGLHVVKEGEYIEGINNANGNSYLLSRGDNFEVIQIEYSSGTDSLILPLKSPENKDFYYIIKGAARVNGDGTKEILKAGDSFYIHDLKEILRFHVLEDLKILWFSSEPMFDITYEYHKLRYSYLEKIQHRDNYTAEHCSRVTEYTLRLLKKMNFPIERIVSTLHSATLHDVGKIHIPDDILNKPSKLTAEEFNIMKKHPEYGVEVVRNIVNESVHEAIIQHHERIDGRGYPVGLRGDEISLEAKILAVVDSYDAMTTDRPYRKGMLPREAVEELKNCIGTHYEKDIVEKFEEVLKEDRII